MSHASVPIDQWMTSNLFTIGDDRTLFEARTRMREHQVRHLPVLRAGRVRGIVSERDIALVESLPGVDASVVTIAEAMTEEPYIVQRGTPTRDVVDEMAKHKYGATLVVDGERPIGIFTTIDALNLVSKLLQSDAD